MSFIHIWSFKTFLKLSRYFFRVRQNPLEAGNNGKSGIVSPSDLVFSVSVLPLSHDWSGDCGQWSCDSRLVSVFWDSFPTPGLWLTDSSIQDSSLFIILKEDRKEKWHLLYCSCGHLPNIQPVHVPNYCLFKSWTKCSFKKFNFGQDILRRDGFRRQLVERWSLTFSTNRHSVRWELLSVSLVVSKFT